MAIRRNLGSASTPVAPGTSSAFGRNTSGLILEFALGSEAFFGNDGGTGQVGSISKETARVRLSHWANVVTGAGPFVLVEALTNKYDDSAAAGMILHLPVALSHGSEVEVKEVGASANSVTITTAGGGTNIETIAGGVATSDALNASRAHVKYKWDATNSVWRIVGKTFI